MPYLCDGTFFLEVDRDELARNPWEDCDTIATERVSNHRDYAHLADRMITDKDEMRIKEIHARKLHGLPATEFMLPPVYAYIHSGISLSVNPLRPYPFNDEWDSSLFILAFTSKKDAVNMFGELSDDELQEKLNAAWTTDVALLNAWLNNEVYSFRLMLKDDDEEECSCGGIYASSIQDLQDQIKWHAGHLEGFDEFISKLEWYSNDKKEFEREFDRQVDIAALASFAH